MIDKPAAESIPPKKEDDFLYLKLVKDIKNGILTGEFLPGTQLPSYNELAKTYGIHRLTVRRALRDLKQEGLVYTIPAKGVYISKDGEAPPPEPGKNGTAWTIGIVNDIVEPWLFGYFHFEILEQIRILLQRDLHSLQILPTGRQNHLEHWVTATRTFELTGLILLGPLNDEIVEELSRMKPCIHLDPQCPRIGSTSVNVDNEYGGYLGARHLLELGHTDIAVIHAVDQHCSDQRLAGVRKAVAEAANPDIQLRLYAGNFSSVSGSEMARQILGETRRPTAIFCFNDEMAVGALQTLTAASLSVPGDISVMGFDDVSISTVVSPPLTTIRVSTIDLAHTAVYAMEQKLSGRQTNEVHHNVIPRLVVRASTAPPSPR